MNIENQKACDKSKKESWNKWHSNTPPDLIPETPNISFSKGCEYTWELVEKLQARISELELRLSKSYQGAPDRHGCDADNNLSKTCVIDENVSYNCIHAKTVQKTA
ncbi:MAG: hypothetical protein OEM38_04010 [Gammaproteobacteria bacterium]|nr:hypothetical protein [Gammaproteobacteria bacterium]